jgi:hypothetical protein
VLAEQRGPARWTSELHQVCRRNAQRFCQLADVQQGQLDNNQPPTVSDFLTKHTLTGNLLQTGILGYFAINDALDQLDARSLGVVTHRMPSFGTFATSLQPEYVYGVPRSVKLAGLSMDVDRIFTLAASTADKAEDAVVFFRTTGPRKSAFERLVPEQLFSTEEQPAEAISAVKALAIAASQGQKIYTITQANAAQVNELTISAAMKQEITAAINAGKEVTVHQNPITYAGWTGEGYIVIDPETGAGAWKLSGGRNGGNGSSSSDEELALIGMSIAAAAEIPVGELEDLAKISALGAAAGFMANFLSCNTQLVLVGAAFVVLAAILARIIAIAIALGKAWWATVSVALVAAFGMSSASAADVVFDPGNVACTCPPERLNRWKTQCWVCELSEKEPARIRVNNAKDRVGELGGSCGEMDSSQLLQDKFSAWTELAGARDFENSCYEPPYNYPGPTHRGEAVIAHGKSEDCEKLLAR